MKKSRPAAEEMPRETFPQPVAAAMVGNYSATLGSLPKVCAALLSDVCTCVNPNISQCDEADAVVDVGVMTSCAGRQCHI